MTYCMCSKPDTYSVNVCRKCGGVVSVTARELAIADAFTPPNPFSRKV